MAEALVLGKFLPPHAGHLHLIEFAQRFAGKARVVVEEIPEESIPVALRAAWLRELCPSSEVLTLRDLNPQEPTPQRPDFWQIWRQSLLRCLGRPPDYVVASEPYGGRLAAELGARFIPLDGWRSALPISGTAIRKAPWQHWEYLPAPVRAHFAARVRLMGAESTGKSQLARRLAEHFKTRAVPEFAESMLRAEPARELTPELLQDFAKGQLASEDSLARHANRLLICDTCATTTALWHELLFKAPHPQIQELASSRRYALTLVCAADVPFVSDSHRVAETTRAPYQDLLRRALLDETQVVTLHGDWEARFQTAVEAIQRALPWTSNSTV
ncbi:MAG: AAA family ATPase [Polyangiaceae bacterium]|nr:AAA family ATPase [Polyangiaceae bacterium]